MPLKPTGKIPPILDFNECLSAVDKIYNASGRSPMARELFAQALGYSPKSSGVSIRVACLRQHNLVEEVDGSVVLTSAAMQIVAPTDGDGGQFKMECFLQIPTYRSLFDKYSGGKLPSNVSIKNTLFHEKKLEAESAEKWALQFVTGVEACGLVSGTGDNRILLKKPVGMGISKAEEKTPHKSEETSPPPAKPKDAEDEDLSQYILIPFGNRVAKIPNDLAPAQYDALKGMIEAFKTSKEIQP